MDFVDAHVHLGYSIPTDDVIKQMSECNVKKIVIFALPAEIDEGLDMNYYILKKAEKFNEFIPFYYVTGDLKIPDEIDLFRGLKWHWVRGLTHIRSNLNLFEDKSFLAFLRELNELKLPIVIEEDFEFTKEFVNIMDNSVIIIPHLGTISGNPNDFLKEFAEYDNVYFDTALASESLINKFYNELGADKLIFGSDIPFGTMKNELNKILKMEIPKSDIRRITKENILKILK